MALVGCNKNDTCTSRIDKIRHFICKFLDFVGFVTVFLKYILYNKLSSCPQSYFIPFSFGYMLSPFN